MVLAVGSQPTKFRAIPTVAADLYLATQVDLAAQPDYMWPTPRFQAPQHHRLIQGLTRRRTAAQRDSPLPGRPVGGHEQLIRTLLSTPLDTTKRSRKSALANTGVHRSFRLESRPSRSGENGRHRWAKDDARVTIDAAEP